MTHGNRRSFCRSLVAGLAVALGLKPRHAEVAPPAVAPLKVEETYNTAVERSAPSYSRPHLSLTRPADSLGQPTATPARGGTDARY